MCVCMYTCTTSSLSILFLVVNALCALFKKSFPSYVRLSCKSCIFHSPCLGLKSTWDWFVCSVWQMPSYPFHSRYQITAVLIFEKTVFSPAFYGGTFVLNQAWVCFYSICLFLCQYCTVLFTLVLWLFEV